MNAKELIDYMSKVWEIHSEPQEGGLLLYESDLYEQDRDARTVLKRLGAKQVYPMKMPGDGTWYAWRLPCGELVKVARHGNAIAPVRRQKNRRQLSLPV